MANASLKKVCEYEPGLSPARKRTRLDPTANDTIVDSGKWNSYSYLNNDLVLDKVADVGVAQLHSDSEEETEEPYPNFLNLSQRSDNNSPLERDKQLAVMLESTLSKETLQKLTLGQWDDLVIQKPKRDFTFRMNHFDQLSDEVVLQIFYELPKPSLANAALVCQRWHRLAQDESLWTRMDVSCRYLEPGALGHILSRQVLILRLSNADISNPIIITDVKAASPDFKSRLLYLDLSMANISCGGLVVLFSKCQRLKKLSLEHVTVNNEVMLALSRNRELEVLNLAMTEGLELDGIRYLLTNCTKLKELNVAWTYLNTVTVNFLCSHLPATLDRLNLSGCRKHICDKNAKDLVVNCPKLRELDLSDCTGLSGAALTHIVLLKELNCLALSRCYFIPYQALSQLRGVSSLKFLEVHGGYLDEAELERIQVLLGPEVCVNKFKFSSIARPTVATRRSSIWGLRVRD